MPPSVASVARHQMAPPPGASRRGCAPPSFLFLSSLRTRGSSIVVFVFVFPLSVILDISNRGSSVVLFAKTGRSKDLGSPIESRMTEGRKQRHPWRHVEGACRCGCAAVPNFLWGRGLFERSEFRSPNHSGLWQRHPKGRAWAPMVLDPFAETKGSRRAGAKPRKHSLSPCGGETPQSSLHSVPPLRSRQARRLE